jgi:hypothetical protein
VFVVGAIVTTMMSGPTISWLVPTKEVERIMASYRPQDILDARNAAGGHVADHRVTDFGGGYPAKPSGIRVAPVTHNCSRSARRSG